MDHELPVSEKHGGDRSYRKSLVSEVEFKELDRFNRSEMFELSQLYYLFCSTVNGEDVSELKEFELPNGEKTKIIEAEARLYAYLYSGCSIQVGSIGPRVVCFLIYQPIFESVIAIRCLYVEQWANGLRLAKEVVNSLSNRPKKIIFQTRIKSPDRRIDAITEKYRTEVMRDKNFITWMMDWEG